MRFPTTFLIVCFTLLLFGQFSPRASAQCPPGKSCPVPVAAYKSLPAPDKSAPVASGQYSGQYASGQYAGQYLAYTAYATVGETHVRRGLFGRARVSRR
jgi:hypothetical protein